MTKYMSLGSKIINELARRRELGMYFDYAGYRALQRIECDIELSTFLREHGYPDVPLTTNMVLVADLLRDSAGRTECQSLLTWIAFDPFGGIAALPLWLLSRLA